MGVTQATGQGLGKIIGFTFKGFFKYSIAFLAIAFIIVNAVIIGVQEKSLEPVIQDLGSRVLHTTEALNREALIIIDRGGLTTRNDSLLITFWEFFKNSSGFLSLIFIVLLWLKVLAWIVSRSPFSIEGNFFINYGLATIIYITLQIIFILYTVGPEGLSLPIDCIINVFRAIPYIVSPIADIADKISPVSNNSNFTNSSS